MCGIAGFLGKGGLEDLERMTRTVLHRGPDDTGTSFIPGVGLGHTRLAILDLSPLGHQPMFGRGGDVVVVFNGEIYNFEVLKRELEGYPWKTHSDTEVILALYEKYGEELFAKLSGMFAIALYDKKKEKLVLARDPAGKKPLFWGNFDGTIVFGSEMKTVLAHPSARKEIDPFSLESYLALDYVPTPRSIFKNISKMEPGSYRVFEKGGVRSERFWEIPRAVDRTITFGQALDEVDRLLARSVKDRLVADVPVGVFLSGGIDSSAVAYYAKQIKQDVQTFSIGFEDAAFDESSHAREVAKYLGTRHFERMVSPGDLLAVVGKVPELFDEPVADSSVIPTYLLSQFTKEFVTVALGGDGGDELFAGYPTFHAEQFVPALRPFAGLGRKISRYLPETGGYLSPAFKIQKFFEGVESGPIRRHLSWLGNSGRSKRVYEPFEAEFGEWGDDSGNRLLALYARTYLMDQVLVKVDRASMAHALEVRAPFLDRNLIEYAFRLPYAWKQHGLTGKYLLKRLMESPDSSGRARLPSRVVWRSKHGFAIPLARWLRGDLRAWAEELLNSGSVGELGIDRAFLEKIWKEHQSGVRDHRKQLWNILTLLMWHKRWVL